MDKYDGFIVWRPHSEDYFIERNLGPLSNRLFLVTDSRLFFIKPPILPYYDVKKILLDSSLS